MTSHGRGKGEDPIIGCGATDIRSFNEEDRFLAGNYIVFYRNKIEIIKICAIHETNATHDKAVSGYKLVHLPI